VEVEAFVQVETHPQPLLLDDEEAAQPRAEERQKLCIGVGQGDAAICLCPLTCVKRNSRNECLSIRQNGEALTASFIQSVDLA
jgi:hypothetical protein